MTMRRIELQTKAWVSLYIDEDTIIAHNRANGVTDLSDLKSVAIAMETGFCPLTEGECEELELSEGTTQELLMKGVSSDMFDDGVWEDEDDLEPRFDMEYMYNNEEFVAAFTPHNVEEVGLQFPMKDGEEDFDFFYQTFIPLLQNKLWKDPEESYSLEDILSYWNEAL